jgi:flagellin
MALRINTNVTALNAHKNLAINDDRLSGSIERLSSGLRINRAADDAAGLTISEKLRTQVRGINRAILNVQDGISMIQTAEGALNETQSMLQRMRELAIQSSNDTLTTTDRLEIQKEIQQLKEDINRIAYGTEFNTKKLLDGSGTAAVSTSNPQDLIGVPTGEVLTFSDFSVAIYPKQVTLADGSTTTLDGQAAVSRSAIFTRTDGLIASSTTTLASISNFYDNYGNFILDLPQTLYLQGNNSQGKFVVSKDLTLEQFAQRLEEAATQDQLGVGLHFDGSEVYFSDSGDTNGQLIMTSGKKGMVGRVNVTGEEDLVKALGFQEVIPPEDAVYSISSTNIGPLVGTRKTLTTQVAGNRAAGLINGIDLIFTPPTQAFVNSQESFLGVSLPTSVAFTIDDSVSSTSSVNVEIPAGRWSMNQVMSMINTAITSSATPPYIVASLNDEYAIQFTTKNAGSAAYLSITGVLAPNPLGIANGRFTGTGGTAASKSANFPPTTFDFSTATQTFNIWDWHDRTISSVAVTLSGNYSAGGMTSLVDAINMQISTNINNKIRAYDNNGSLAFRSLETGIDSGFTISAGATAPWLMVGDVDSDPGSGGDMGVQDFAYDQQSVMFGFPLVDNLTPGATVDDLVFYIADLDGRGKTITISAGTTSAGNTFKPLTDIVNQINLALNPDVKVNAEINKDTDPYSLRFFSTIPGKNGKITFAEQSDASSLNTLKKTFDIDVGTYDNGVGDYAFTMHVKDRFVQFQIGPNQGHFAKANMIRCDTLALNVDDLDLTTVKDAQRAIGLIDKALQYISSERAKLGAIENRMTYTSNSLRVGLENMSAADSRIRDVDMAREVVELTRFQILQQSSNAMLGQANASAQRVLDLLR